MIQMKKLTGCRFPVVQIVALVMLCLCLCGCATCTARSDSERGHPFANGMLYPATRVDVFAWAVACWPEEKGGYLSDLCDYSRPTQWLVTPAATVLCLVDLVPSIVVDTAFLPYDWYVKNW